MKVKASNLSRGSSHSVTSTVTTARSSLEEINPAEAARLQLLAYKIVLFLAILSGCIFTIVGFVQRGLVGFVGIIFIIISYLIYIHLSRVAIAPLMTWHFCKENASVNRKLLGEVVALRHELAKQQENSMLNIGVGVKPDSQHQSPSSASPSTTVCPGCGATYAVTPETRGRKVQCPACNTTFLFPW